MPGTDELRAVLYTAGFALSLHADSYAHRPDGSLYHHGTRPGDEWIGHGTFPRLLYVLTLEGLKRVLLHKQRWKRREPVAGLPRTCHSRPPNDLAQVWSCAAVVALSLWSWLHADAGLHTHEPVLPELREHPSTRTRQRWLARALPLATATQQALRRTTIERSEPRPVEQLFESGLSPPKRRWRNPSSVWTLETGLAYLMKATVTLDVTIPRLLAEARGRWHRKDKPFLI